jgi:hypothetical protein
MAATVWTEACNIALSLIGGKLIQSPDEASVEARSCALFLGQTRREILSGHPWNAATRWKTLALIGEAGKNGNERWPYRYAFTVPADCLRILRLETGLPIGSLATISARTLPYLIGGISGSGKDKKAQELTALFCDALHPLLVYLCDLDDPHWWPPKLMQALIFSLASKLALPLSEKTNLAQALDQKYQLALREAMSVDASEGHGNIPPDDTYLRERAGRYYSDPIGEGSEVWRR